MTISLTTVNQIFAVIQAVIQEVQIVESNGIGLAANQIGIPYRIFAMRGSPENFVCFNPKIITFSEEEILLEEGCLTYPDLIVKIKRPKHLRVRFSTPNGDTRTETFTGITARIYQHEMDHIDGIIFYNKAHKYYRNKAFHKHNLLKQKRLKDKLTEFKKIS